jgi:RNA polymerase sigma-70 factor (ECF subfamily)
LSPEQLLQDAAWLRGLARTLAHDRDDADDLVQESWIAAWQRQPDASRPLRGWLTKVVRDLAGMKRRSEQRRAAREADTHDARAAAAPDELLERMRLHRLLVDLVLDLDEPYRSTIIAHFVEDRTLASIAKSLGIPAGTVRKRLWVALSRLRAGLDARSGERKAWAPAVLAFAKGGIQVAKSTKLVFAVIAAVLLIGIATVVLVTRPRSHEVNTRDSRASSPAQVQARGSSDTSPADASAASNTGIAAVRSDARAGEHAAERAAMLEAIAKARSKRMAAPDRAVRTPRVRSATGGDSSGTTLDIVDKTGDTSEWSKRALGTLNSLLGQCYDLGHAEDPALGGTIAVHFVIVGEPNVGGLLETVEIVDEGTTIVQPTFRDCVMQQLYALELDPPPDGVTVERQLTLRL